VTERESSCGIGELAQPSARLEERISNVDWPRASRDLDDQGWALISGLLGRSECESAARWYTREEGFRSRVVMARHGFGCGEYRYFSYPLPALVQELRGAIYARLAPVGNRWNERMGTKIRFPIGLDTFLRHCHAVGQSRPTPLLLKYGPGDYNCLHQDLYGESVFPLQVAILLSQPEVDFSGGEFILTEQRPRKQTRAAVVPVRQGDAVVFAVNNRPMQGLRGDYQVRMRHGVSQVRSGNRYTLGVIFHDAT
jgi:hypothetical protein